MSRSLIEIELIGTFGGERRNLTSLRRWSQLGRTEEILKQHLKTWNRKLKPGHKWVFQMDDVTQHSAKSVRKQPNFTFPTSFTIFRFPLPVIETEPSLCVVYNSVLNFKPVRLTACLYLGNANNILWHLTTCARWKQSAPPWKHNLQGCVSDMCTVICPVRWA